MNRILLRRAQVVDGTGAPAYVADVLVEGARIGSDLPLDAQEVLDAQGLTLSPGFIDVHTHDDAQVLRDPVMLAKLSQGVTSVITGNCGLSLVPLVTGKPPSPLDLLHTTEFRFSQLSQYAHALGAAPAAVNVGALIGHTTLRVCTMADLSRPADAREIEAMAELLDRALGQGALGLSSGLFYQQAFAADAAEMQALVRVVAPRWTASSRRCRRRPIRHWPGQSPGSCRTTNAPGRATGAAPSRRWLCSSA